MSLVELGTVALLAILLIYLLIVALRLRVDYFDSYQSLVNARTIIHGGQGEYFVERSILYPVLLTPIFLLETMGVTGLVEFVAAHVLAVLLLALFLYASFKLYRLHLARPWALAGALLLSWNLLLINNAPLAKEDIPGALFATASFFFYLRARETGRWRYFLLAGVAIGATMLTRYNLAPLLFVVIWSYEIGSFISRRRKTGWRWPSRRTLLMNGVCLFGLPVTLFFLLPMIVYPIIGHASVLDAPGQFVNDIIAVLNESNAQAKISNEDTIRNYRFVVESVTWPLLFCAFIGGLASLRSRQPGSLLYLLWFVVIFGAQTYAISHKEARYLFAAFPALYFFVARGLMAVADASLTLPRLHMVRAARVAVITVLLLLPAWNALAAAAKFTDPVYTSDYEAQVSQYAERLAGDGAIYWVGPSYPLHPREYVFDLADPYTYMYHDFSHVAEYWTDRPVYWLPGLQVVAANPDGPLFVGPGIGNIVTDGSVLIVNRAPQSYETATVPASLPPLVVEQVMTLVYTAATPGAGAGSQSFNSASAPGLVRVARQGVDWVVEGVGLPDGQFELYSSAGPATSRAVPPVTVTAGAFKVGVLNADWPASGTDRIVLLYFGLALSFPASTDR